MSVNHTDNVLINEKSWLRSKCSDISSKRSYHMNSVTLWSPTATVVKKFFKKRIWEKSICEIQKKRKSVCVFFKWFVVSNWLILWIEICVASEFKDYFYMFFSIHQQAIANEVSNYYQLDFSDSLLFEQSYPVRDNNPLQICEFPGFFSEFLQFWIVLSSIVR